MVSSCVDRYTNGVVFFIFFHLGAVLFLEVKTDLCYDFLNSGAKSFLTHLKSNPSTHLGIEE